MNLKHLRFFLSDTNKEFALLGLIEKIKSKFPLTGHSQLPTGFTINLVDKASINNNNQDFHSFILNSCWVLIDDGSANKYPDIYKTAIHKTTLDHMANHYANELLIVFDKCIMINKLFKPNAKSDVIQIQKLDRSYEVHSIDEIILFTNINRSTYMFYESEAGLVDNVIVRDSLVELENKLHGCKFFRTHKKYLINANHLQEKLFIDSNALKMSHQLSAILSIHRKDDFIAFLESL